MRSYKDFLRIKSLLENSKEDEDEYLPVEYNEYLIDYGDDEGHYPTKKTFFAKKEDVQDGELVPELCKYFHANIIADDIGLTSLKYFPSLYVENLNVAENEITDLRYCPDLVDGNFICDSNKITSLKDGPSNIHGDFQCSNNLLTNLEGFPKEVDDEINLSGNIHLTSLEGLPSHHHQRLDLDGCISLKDLKHCPIDVAYLHLNNVPINSFRDLAGKRIESITDHKLSNVELDFFYAVANNAGPNFNYDQALADYIIELIEADKLDFEELDKIHLDFNKIEVPDKYLNLFKSAKTINRYNL